MWVLIRDPTMALMRVLTRVIEGIAGVRIWALKMERTLLEISEPMVSES